MPFFAQGQMNTGRYGSIAGVINWTVSETESRSVFTRGLVWLNALVWRDELGPIYCIATS